MDNAPQTRYLLPLARRFEEEGGDVLLTARDHGETFAILRNEGTPFVPVGSFPGSNRLRKLAGLFQRKAELIRMLEGSERPALLISGARSAALTGRKLHIPTFVILDYEYVDVLAYRFASSNIVHPDVIDEQVLRSRGLRERNLMPFAGLKEDFTFAGLDLDAIAPAEFGGDDGVPRVLFRPPAEESHYYRSESGRLSMELLRHLASRGAKVVFSPRYAWQVSYLEQVANWSHEPIVLREPAQFVSLLKGVDAVVSAGGTMLR